MKFDKVLALAKTIRIPFNQNHPVKLEILYCGVNENGQDLFQVRDNLGRFYALQDTIEEAIESLDQHIPVDLKY